jgi:tetratricopeptide (TPR) repeat protein
MPPMQRTRSTRSLVMALVFISPGAAGPALGAGASQEPSMRPSLTTEIPPLSIRSRQIEIHYRLTGPAEGGDVELWYTRDRGISWQCAGKDGNHASPVLFTAPGEGLYGLLLIPCVAGRPIRPAPVTYEPPQRWVFIDATPPLAQWNGVEPADDFARTRTLQLRWTAHDDNFPVRPITLLYQSSIDQAWRSIDDAVANVGVYDWKVPENAGGNLSLKLMVRDEGGHVVERVLGPLNLDKFIVSTGTRPAAEAAVAAEGGRTTGGAATMPASTSRPANDPGLLPGEGLADAASRPASEPRVDLLRQRMATDLYRQGSWHLVRGQYAVAAERLREALEQNPDLLEARQDLAGIFYRQQDYDRAISEYEAVLSRNGKHESALYGAALAYVAKRDYHQSREMLTRLLAVDDRNAEAWLDLGDVLFMMGDVVNARGDWRRALKIDPTAQEIISKAQRRLELYGSADETIAAGPRTTASAVK